MAGQKSVDCFSGSDQAEVHKGVVQAVFVHIVGHIVGGGFGFRAAAAQSHAVP